MDPGIEQVVVIHAQGQFIEEDEPFRERGYSNVVAGEINTDLQHGATSILLWFDQKDIHR